MCGLFGYTGTKPPDLNIIKILGLYNQSRGEHSCGISIDGEIKKGIDDKKLFGHFIVENILQKPKLDFTVIGHTRSATSGTTHSAENAHPFLIHTEGREDDMIFSHNGVIHNIADICKENGVEHKWGKVDSQMLGEIIYKTKSFKVLETYKGFAALAFYDKNKPNTLYLYKGESKNAKGELESERPLFYMETKNGLYYSSMSNPLFAVRESDKQKVYILEPNVVHYFENGKLKTEFKVKRPVNINEEKKVLVQGCGMGNTGSTCAIDLRRNVNKDKQNLKKIQVGAGSEIYSIPLDSPEPDTTRKFFMSEVMFNPLLCSWTLKSDNKINLVKDGTNDWFFALVKTKLIRVIPEENPQENRKGLIYYFSGRYRRNGHLIDGIMWVDERGVVIYQEPSEAQKATFRLCHFYRGVLLKDRLSYDYVMFQVKTHGKKFWREMNFAYTMSKFSLIPVKNTKEEGKGTSSDYRYDWFLNGSIPKSGLYVPFLTQYVYRVVDIGVIHPIHKLEHDSPVIERVRSKNTIKLLEGSKITGWPDFPIHIMPDEVSDKMARCIKFMLADMKWKLDASTTTEEQLDELFVEDFEEWNAASMELGDMFKYNWKLDANEIPEYVKLFQQLEREEEEKHDNEIRDSIAQASQEESSLSDQIMGPIQQPIMNEEELVDQNLRGFGINGHVIIPDQQAGEDNVPWILR